MNGSCKNGESEWAHGQYFTTWGHRWASSADDAATSAHCLLRVPGEPRRQWEGHHSLIAIHKQGAKMGSKQQEGMDSSFKVLCGNAREKPSSLKKVHANTRKLCATYKWGLAKANLVVCRPPQYNKANQALREMGTWWLACGCWWALCNSNFRAMLYICQQHLGRQAASRPFNVTHNCTMSPTQCAHTMLFWFHLLKYWGPRKLLQNMLEIFCD